MVKTKNKNLSTSVTKKSVHQSIWKRLRTIMFGAFLIAVASKYFIIYSGIYSSGLGGFAQGITYTIWDNTFALAETTGMNEAVFKNTFYWILNIILNIPIIIFAHKKFGKDFAKWSVIGLTMSFGWSMFFTYTPGFNTLEIVPGWIDFQANNVGEVGMLAIAYILAVISAVMAGIMHAIGVSLYYKSSVSSLGVDPIGKYVSNKKGTNISLIVTVFSMVNVFFWTIFRGALAGDLKTFEAFLGMILSPAIIATVLFLSLYKMTMDKIFPTSSKMELSIIAQNHSEIVDHFNEIGFHRTHTKQKITGGYSKEEKIVLKYIVTATEMRDLVKEVQSVSPNAFITINVLQNIYGNFVLRSKTIHETGRDKKLNKKKAKAEAKLEKQANAHQEKKLVKTKTVIMKHVPKSKARAASKSKKTNQKTSKAKAKTTKK